MKKMEEESKAAMMNILRQKVVTDRAKLEKREEIKKKIVERSEKIKKDHLDTETKYAEVKQKKN